MLDVFSTLDLIATKEQRDAINEQRRSEGKKEISPSDIECQNLKKTDCYSWLNRTVSSKE